MRKSEFRVIGVMSGTSLDGIDLVFTEIRFKENVQFSILASETFAYSAGWRRKLTEAIHLDPTSLNSLDIEYTSFLAEVVNTFIRKFDIDLLDAVCSHGHTVQHQPKNGITLQIGNLPKLAKLIGVPVICDFRVQDVELGGQGAPLVPIGDKLLFKDYKYCVNLGGFANISHEEKGERIAYDICPVNTVFNYYMQKLDKEYDSNGELARSGSCNQELLKELDALSFYNRPAPKSLGIEWVNSHVIPIIEKYNLNIADSLNTFAIHASGKIAKSLDDDAQSKVLISGGGVYNTYFIELLRSKTPCNISIADPEITDFKEAIIFALLGVLKLRGEVNVLSSVTGAKMDHSSGRRYEP